ncbi:unnamed protein product, partial [Oikopleura dioica]
GIDCRCLLDSVGLGQDF